MELFELILFLLGAVVVSSLLDQILRGVSLPLVQILLGIVIALVLPLPQDITIDAELLLILFIAPLHFNETRHVDSAELYRNRFGIASLVTGLVLLTMVALGFSLHALIPAIPLAAALAFGAAMGSTDASAVTSLAKEMRFGRRHEALLNGEALFNDVTGTIGFQCAIAVVVSGAFSLTHAGEEFVMELFGGMIVGVLLGLAFWGLMALMRRFGLDNPTVHVVLELLTPFIIFLICEQIHVGGVIAVVMAGLTISLLPHKRTVATSHQKIQASSVWKTLEFVLNGVIFVVLGMQIPHVLIPAIQADAVTAWLLIVTVLLLTIVLEAVRFVWILGLDLLATWHNKRPLRICFSKRNLKGTLGMAFAGPKGGVTLALILTIPYTISSGAEFPMRQEILFITSGVILCTLLLANFAVRILVPRKPNEKRSKQYADAELMLLTQVIESVQADAHLTGTVTGEQALTAMDKTDEAHSENAEGSLESSLPDNVDEPATAIVMKRYADHMRDFIPLASPEVATQAKILADRCDELYNQVNAFEDELSRIYDDDNEDAEGLEAHILALKNIQNAVDDIQDSALARELELIKKAQRAEQLSKDHARKLRNDVYVQQMTLD